MTIAVDRDVKQQNKQTNKIQNKVDYARIPDFFSA